MTAQNIYNTRHPAKSFPAEEVKLGLHIWVDRKTRLALALLSRKLTNSPRRWEDLDAAHEHIWKLALRRINPALADTYNLSHKPYSLSTHLTHLMTYGETHAYPL